RQLRLRGFVRTEVRWGRVLPAATRRARLRAPSSTDFVPPDEVPGRGTRVLGGGGRWAVTTDITAPWHVDERSDDDAGPPAARRSPMLGATLAAIGVAAVLLAVSVCAYTGLAPAMRHPTP